MKKSDVYKRIIEEHENKCVNPHIGVIIKKRRKDLNMTLEDVTKGICCVSYLSKLEHGTIIPKQYVLREVLERLEMNENNIRSKNEYIKMIVECLSLLYYEEYDGIKNYFESLATVEKIHFADIIKAIYYFSINNIDMAKKFIDDALILKNDLEDIELNACIIISALIAESDAKYGEALEIIKRLDNRFIERIEINKLRIMIKNRLNLICGNYVILQRDLGILEEMCRNTIDFKAMITIKEQMGLILAYNGYGNEALKIYDTIKMAIGDKASNSYLKEIYKALKKPNELLKNCKSDDLDKLWAYNLVKNSDKCIDILDRLNLEDATSDYQRLFMEAMMKKYYESEYFYIVYLKEIFYPYALEHYLYEDSKWIRDQLVKYYISDAKYKDAIKTTKDFEKIFS